LKPSNVKATAKKRLLAALDAGTLQVPDRILQIEEELKELYREANEVAKEKYYKEQEEREKRGGPKGGDRFPHTEMLFKSIIGASSFEQACEFIEQGKKQHLKAEDYTATFDLSCPTAVSEWPDHCDPLSIYLQLGVHEGALWGRYDLGIFSGIVLFSHIPTVSNEFVPCSWRGRKYKEGMSFGKDCTGKIAFLPNRRLAGTLNVYGDLAFGGIGWGSKVTTEVVKGCKDEWGEFNERQRDYEARMLLF